MSHVKKIAIVGRPNVGKSALFNAIAKKRISIVDEAEGITRDRIYAACDFFNYPFELIDTGGIDFHSNADFIEEIRRQAHIAIEEADSIIMVVDARCGVQELDVEVAKILHTTKKPLCLAVNKVDNYNERDSIYEFSKLGIKDIVAVSAVHTFHIAELLEVALKSFDKTVHGDAADETTKIAIIGRPNVGKSYLLNSLLGEDRSIVSEIAGTTRDAIDTKITFEGKDYLLIDTAGIRRKFKEKDVVEKFAAIRSKEALDRADIAILVIDAMQGMTSEEKKIARGIEEEGKGCLVLFNKWDLAKGKGFRMEHAAKSIEDAVPFLSYCPKIFISAKTGRNLEKIMPEIVAIVKTIHSRIATPALNKCVIAAMQKYHPPAIKGKRLRIYYLAQIDTTPLKFMLFVNSPKLMEESYKKYLINQLRETFELKGAPIVLELRGKEKKRRPQLPPHMREQGGKGFDRDLPHEESGVEEDEFEDDEDGEEFEFEG